MSETFRLAQFLLAQSRQSGKTEGRSVMFRQPLTHSQLATRIGTVREVVSRVMFRLQEQGLINADGRAITIPDREALERYAGERE